MQNLASPCRMRAENTRRRQRHPPGQRARAGVDFTYLLKQAATESSLNPSAKRLDLERVGPLPVH